MRVRTICPSRKGEAAWTTSSDTIVMDREVLSDAGMRSPEKATNMADDASEREFGEEERARQSCPQHVMACDSCQRSSDEAEACFSFRPYNPLP